MSDLKLQTEIVRVLNSDARVSLLLGKRVFPSEAINESSEEEYLVYDQISGDDEKTHDGDTDTPISVLEFKIYSPSARGRLRVADAVRLAFREAEGGTNGGIYLASLTREYVYDSKETVTREKAGKRTLYRRLVNYRIRWQDKTETS